MSEIIFNCRKCGTCCRNLIENVNGINTGLLLTVKEIDLFPSKMVSPKLAIGFEKPEKIIQYQLNVGDCPHINEKNECKIYEKRPLVCRAFPRESGSERTPTISIKCPVIGSQMKEYETREVEVSVTEIEASEKMNRHILNRSQKLHKIGHKRWNFDVKTGKWILTTGENLYRPF
jgi:Fe-S-cluster containining protein